MQERFKISVQRSCRLSQLQPSVWYAKSQARDQTGLRLRIREIAMARPRFGDDEEAGKMHVLAK